VAVCRLCRCLIGCQPVAHSTTGTLPEGMHAISHLSSIHQQCTMASTILRACNHSNRPPVIMLDEHRGCLAVCHAAPEPQIRPPLLFRV
jgi:hypothetical protein